jgi:hypothetical protein
MDQPDVRRYARYQIWAPYKANLTHMLLML